MLKYKRYIFQGGVIFLICLTLIVSTFLISQTDFYIKDISGTDLAGNKITNTINVSGDGRIYSSPNMVTISFTASELTDTSKQSLEKVNEKINTAKEILKDKGIKDEDIQTTDLSIYPEYDYSGTRSVLKGQRASQTIKVDVKGIENSISKASEIVDDIAKIENIQINSISFDIEDKTELFAKARELAFEKAKSKAEQLSKLSDVKLLKPVSITDNAVDYQPPVYYSANAFQESMAADASRDTGISGGQLEISLTINVLFAID